MTGMTTRRGARRDVEAGGRGRAARATQQGKMPGGLGEDWDVGDGWDGWDWLGGGEEEEGEHGEGGGFDAEDDGA